MPSKPPQTSGWSNVAGSVAHVAAQGEAAAAAEGASKADIGETWNVMIGALNHSLPESLRHANAMARRMLGAVR